MTKDEEPCFLLEEEPPTETHNSEEINVRWKQAPRSHCAAQKQRSRRFESSCD